MLRIIGGQLKGRLLKVPGGSRIRPTSDKVRESLFNIIGPEVIKGARFLDLYAGSGAVGIEAISRGAGFATFIESDSKHIKIIRENLKTCGLINNSQVFLGDVPSMLSSFSSNEKSYDIVFADPPYSFTTLDILLRKIIINVNISDYGIMVIEHSTRVNLPESIDDYVVYRDYGYGDTTLTVYTKFSGK